MYFIPQKNRWYSTFAHIRPAYRYAGLFFGVAILLFFWRYGLYTWLDSAIQHEQGLIAQLENQMLAQTAMQREHDELVGQLPILENACSTTGNCCIGQECYDQCAYLFAQAKKAGMRITAYQSEKESASQIKKSQIVSIGLAGSLDQLQQFLEAIKNSSRMIQCTALTLHADQSGAIAATCSIQFIWPMVEKN